MDSKEKKDLLELRQMIYKIAMKGGMAHLASCFSCIEILYVLFFKGIMRFKNDEVIDINRDRFILSKGHAGLALYAIYVKLKLMDIKDFESYLQDESLIGGEPSKRDFDLIETATGSLGHGLSVAVGEALSLKMDKSKAKVFCLVGDGELQEGVTHEAFTFANAQKLDNLIIIIDNNGIQKMDMINNIIGKVDYKKILSIYDFDIFEVDGHDIDAMVEVLKKSDGSCKTRIIIAKTIKGKGVSIMENNPIWHMKLPNKKEAKVFNSELKIEDDNI